MKTATEFIKEELNKLGLLDKGQVMTNIFEQAKEMEKQQIMDAYYGYELYLDREFRFQQGGQAKILTFDQWYETYGSKGSDEEKTNSQRFDEFMQLVTSSQTEISDEEIEEASKYIQTTNPDLWTFKIAWKSGAKWYREQLKNK